MSDRIDASALLRDARARTGLTQRELARRAGTAQSVVARIESGETSPTVRTLDRLLEAAGLRPEISLRAAPLDGAASGPGGPRGLAQQLAEAIRGAEAGGRLRGLVSAYLYGSAARGTRHFESDVDVAVLLDRDVHPDRAERGRVRVRFASELVGALGINEVDLVVLNDAPPELAARVLLDGIRVAVEDPEADHRFVRDTLLRWGDLQPFLRRMRRIKVQALAL